MYKHTALIPFASRMMSIEIKHTLQNENTHAGDVGNEVLLRKQKDEFTLSHTPTSMWISLSRDFYSLDALVLRARRCFLRQTMRISILPSSSTYWSSLASASYSSTIRRTSQGSGDGRSRLSSAMTSDSACSVPSMTPFSTTRNRPSGR